MCEIWAVFQGWLKPGLHRERCWVLFLGNLTGWVLGTTFLWKTTKKPHQVFWTSYKHRRVDRIVKNHQQDSDSRNSSCPESVCLSHLPCAWGLTALQSLMPPSWSWDTGLHHGEAWRSEPGVSPAPHRHLRIRQASGPGTKCVVVAWGADAWEIVNSGWVLTCICSPPHLGGPRDLRRWI